MRAGVSLPSIDSPGLRFIVRTGEPIDVVHGLWLGGVRAARLPPSVRSLEHIGARQIALEGVAWVDPRTDHVRAQWRASGGCRGVASLAQDRVLSLEGRSLVSRSIDGRLVRVHCSEWLDDGESPLGRLHTDSQIAAVAVSGHRSRQLRVCDLDSGARRSLPLPDESSALSVLAVVERSILTHCDFGVRTVDALTGALRWQRSNVWRFERPSPLELCAVDQVEATRHEYITLCYGAGKRARAARVNPADGRITEQSTNLDDFFRWIGAGRVLRPSRDGGLELVSLQSDSTPQRWLVDAELRDLCWLRGEQWVIVTDRYVCVIDAARGEIIAGEAFATRLHDTATVQKGDGWLAVSTDSPDTERVALERRDARLPVLDATDRKRRVRRAPGPRER